MAVAILTRLSRATAVALILSAPAAGAMPGKPSIAEASRPPAQHSNRSLTVMSYNVEGLPEPARFGRTRPLSEIGAKLAQLRRERREPNVVLLQEAFAGSAKKIGAEAGYRYIAKGPPAALVNTALPPADAAAFVAAASHLRGEGDGKWIGSGLRILSDYPIVSVRQLAFPRWACAGYDCLANKGALIAWIAVPGSREPVAFIDTHLNSRAASGVAKTRADIAYAYQVAALRRFIHANVPSDAAAFLGGDFNSGKARPRWADLKGGVLSGGRNSLLDAIAERNAVPGNAIEDTRAILGRAKDWLFYRGNSLSHITLTGFDVPFGEEDRTMFSDHMGYEAHYRLQPAP